MERVRTVLVRTTVTEAEVDAMERLAKQYATHRMGVQRMMIRFALDHEDQMREWFDIICGEPIP